MQTKFATLNKKKIKQLLFIDAQVENYQHFIAGSVLEVKPIILDSTKDGVKQITDALQNYSDLSSVHIVSHGSSGCLYLGNTQLSLETLKFYVSQLQTWSVNSIVLYGCNVAQGDAGVEFIEKLHQLTGAEIAASANRTGNAALGGDWKLEVTTSKFDVPMAWSQEVMQTYTSVLVLPPAIDLDGDNSSGASGNNYQNVFIPGSGGINIVDLDEISNEGNDTLITDSDSTQLSGATITLTNTKSGDQLNVGTLPTGISALTSTGAGGEIIITLSGTASLLDYETALEAITFNNTLVNPDITNRTINVQVNDALGLTSNTATSTIAINAGQVLISAPTGIAPTETGTGAGKTALWTNVANINGTQINIRATVVSITGGTADPTFATSGDNLVVSATSAGTFRLRWDLINATTGTSVIGDINFAVNDLDGPNIESVAASLNDVTSYTVNNPTNLVSSTANNVVRLSGTQAQSGEETSRVRFSWLGVSSFEVDYISAGSSSIFPRFYTHDGDLDLTFSNPVTVAPPKIDLDGSDISTDKSFETTFYVGRNPVAITDIDTTIADLDNANMASATITLTNAQLGDVLSIAGTLPAGITSNINTGTLGQIVVTLTGSASLANYVTAIEAIRFSNTNPLSSLSDRTINVVVNDGTNSSNIATSTINVVLDPTAPTLISTNPGDNATNVAINSDLALTFSEPIVPGTGTITLKSSDGTVVETFDVATSPQLSFSGNTLIINPTNDLASTTDYYLEISNTAITDAAGNSYAGLSDPAAFNFITEDAIPPAIAISSAAATNDSSPLIIGTTEPNTPVVVAVDTNEDGTPEVTYNITSDGTGNWSVDLATATPTTGSTPNLTNSTIEVRVTATATDAAGNSATATQNLFVDTTPPAIAISSAAATNDTTPVIEGTTEPNTTVVVGIDTNGDGTLDVTYNIVSDGVGNWSLDLETATPATGSNPTLADGSSIGITATATDAVGNSANTIQTLIIDTSLATLSIDSPAATNDSTPVINGSTEPNATVVVALDTNGDGTPDVTYTTTANASGLWSVDLDTASPTSGTASPLSDSTIGITATATDAAGNSATATQNLLVDTTSPAIAISSAAATNDITPVIEGTTEPNTTVAVGIDINGDGTPDATYNIVSDGVGNWSLDLETATPTSGATPTLSDGSSVGIIATATDALGNSAIDTQTLLVDTVPPAITITSPTSTSDTTPVINGSTEPNTTFVVALDTNGDGTPDATYNIVSDGVGNWSLDLETATPTSGAIPTFTDGSSLNVSATATDAAGNSAADTQTLIIDTSTVINITSPTQTNDTTPVIAGTTEVNAAVTVALDTNGDGTPDATYNTTADGVGNWSIDLATATPISGTTPTLTDGSNLNVSATATDAAGNSATDTQTLIIDTTVAINLTSPVAINDTTPIIKGTTEVNAAVTVELDTNGDGTPDVTYNTTGDGVGNWSIDLATATPISGATPTLTDGSSLNITATAIDNVGNSATDTQTLTIDTALPSISITSPTPTNDTTPVIAGTTEANTAVTITLDINNDGTPDVTYNTTADGAGNWSVDLATASPTSGTAPSLSDGSNLSVSATATDASGNSADDTQTLIIDTSIAIDITSPTPTNDTTPVIAGTTEANAAVAVALDTNGDGTPDATYNTTADGTGNWSVDLATATPTSGTTPTLSDGSSLNVSATATDAAGNSAADTQTLIVDTTVAIAITSPTQTSDTTPVIAGTTEANAAIAVTLDTNGDGIPDVTYNTTADGAGNWSIDLETATPTTGTAPTLIDGSSLNVRATATDAAGNSATDTQTLRIDTSITIDITSATPTNDTTPVIAGTTEANAAVAVALDTNGDGTPDATYNTTADGTGNWSVDLATATPTSGTTPTLSDGSSLNVSATATDAAGNSAADTQTLIVDTTVAIDITSPTQTSDTTPVIAGTTEANAAVTVALDTNGDGTPDVSYNTTADGTGNWSIDLATATPTSGTAPSLSDGSNLNVRATATDAAGNSATDTQTLIIDTSIAIDITSPTPTNDTTPVIAGTTEANAAVAVALDTNGDGTPDATYNTTADGTGNWSVDLATATPASGTAPTLANGNTIDVSATATDALGNSATDIQTLIIDTSTVINITSPTPTNDITPVISGATEANAAIAVAIDTNGDGTPDVSYNTTADGTGNWSIDLETATPISGATPTLTDGSNLNVTATATDAAGNSATDTQTLIVDTSTVIDITSPTPTNDTTPVIAGTTEANAAVTVALDTNGDGTPDVSYNTTADGTGNWSVDLATATPTTGANPTLTDGSNLNVRATATDALGNSAIDTQTLIVDTSTVINITSPTTIGSTTPVIAGTTEANAAVTLALDTNGDGTPDVSYNTTADGTGNWSVDLATATPTTGTNPTLSDGSSFNVNATATDALGNSATDTQTLIIDGIIPTLSSSNPTDEATNIAPTSNLVLTFSEAIQAGTGDIILYDSNGNIVETFSVTNGVGSARGSLSFVNDRLTITPGANLTSGTGYYLNLAATAIKDLAGNPYAGINDNATLNFTTIPAPDTTAPTLTSSNPADEAINVAPNSNLVLTFSEAIAAGTGTIVLTRADGTVVESFDVATSNRLTISGNQLTIDPSSDLTASTGYYLNLSPEAIRDLAGNAYAGISDPATLNFNTAAAPDTTAPTLTSSNPGDGTTNVALNSNLVLAFSEAIQAGTGNILLYDSNGNVIETFNIADGTGSARGSLNLASDRLTINPGVDFDPNTGYYLNIDSTAIRDLAGNAYAGINNNATLNFTTSDAPDAIAPILTSSNPADEATNVAPNNNLVLTFNEDIQVGTGTITLYSADGTAIESFNVATSTRLSILGNTLTIDPTNNLSPSTSYYLGIDKGAVRDLAGNAYAGISNSTTLNFSTAAASDTTAPTLISTNPADNAIDVATNNNLLLTFSEAIAAGTGDIILYDSNGTAVETFNVATGKGSAEGSLSFANNQILINPGADLNAGAGYYLTIAPTAIRDLAGNAYVGIGDPAALNFSTAAIPDTTAPILLSSNPTDNATDVAINSNLIFNFSEAIQAGTGTITLTLANGTVVESFDVTTSNRLSISGNTLTLDPSIDLSPTTGYYISIDKSAIRDLAGNPYAGISDPTALNFNTAAIADTTAPTLISSNPADDAIDIAPNNNLILTFSEAIAAGSGTIILTRADGTVVESFDVATSNRLSISGNQITIDPSSDLTASTGYYLNISSGAIEDVAGNAFAGISDPAAFSFTTAAVSDTTAPILISSNPADNTSNVALNSPLVLNFNEAIAAGTGNIILYDSNGNIIETFNVANGTGNVGGSLSFSGAQVTVNPGEDLNPNTGYFLNIDSSAIRDLAGNAYQGINNNTTLNFATEAIPDTTAPILLSSNPADNATNIAPNNNLILTFSEAIRAGTGAIILYDSNGAVVESFDIATSNRLSISGNTLTLNPNANLSPSAGYYLNIAPGAIRDLSGNAYAGISDSTTLNFTTAAVPDTTAPILISSNPADNTNNVALNSALIITFSEAIAANTGNIILYTSNGTVVETFNVANGTGDAGGTLSISGTTVTLNPGVDLSPSTGYYLNIASGALQDLAGNPFAGIDNNTAIDFTTASASDTTAPTLISSNPADNATNIAPNNNLILTFSEAIRAGSGTIVLTRADGTVVESFDVATSNRLSISGNQITIDPNADLTASTGYYLNISPGAIRDLAGNAYAGISDPATLNFSMAAAPDTTAPTLVNSNPVDNAVGVAPNNDLVFTFSEDIQVGTGNIVLYDSNGTVVETFNVASGKGNAGGSLNLVDNTLTLNPGANLSPSAGYYLTIASGAIRDLANNFYAGIGDSTTLNFTTALAPDTTAPTLITTNPIDNATDIALNSNLILTFSEAIAAGAGNIILYDNNGTVVESFNVANGIGDAGGNLSIRGNTITLNPGANLSPSTGYYLNIASGAVRDLASNAFTGITNNTTLNFSTAAALDTTAPTLISSNPADDAIDIAPNNNLILTFSEAIAAGTGTIVLTRADGTVVESFDVATSARLSISGNQISIDPSSDLTANTGYYLNITSGAIEDIAGNAFAGISTPTALNFNTAGEPDTLAPILVSSNPGDGATDIALNNNLVLTFSETIQAGTGDILLYDSNGNVVETFNVVTKKGSAGGSLSIEANTITLNPGANLSPSTGYYLNISPGAIRDLAGNAFAGIGDNTTLDFGTTTTPDTIPPTLTGSNPADNATDIALNNSLVFTFSEAIQAGTGTITLYRADGTVIETFDVATSNGLSISGNTLAIDPSADFSPNTGYYIDIDPGAVRDLAGNGFAGIEDPTALNFTSGTATDEIVPTIANITSLTANGRYKAGDRISIQIIFSEAVLVAGVPTLILETGTSDRVINYSSGSGTNTLTFTYTVQPGDSSNDLEYLSANALSLNGGTITDLAGNNANISLPAPGAPNSLSANKDLAIDTLIPDPPSITSSSRTSDTTPLFSGTAEPGNRISVSIDVDGDGNPDVTYETTVDEQGNWSLDLDTATPTSGQRPVLGSGNQLGLSVRAIDGAGNISEAATQTLLIALLAVDDAISISSGGSTVIDILGNDSNPDGSSFSITGITQPSQGTVIIDDNGTPNNPNDDRLIYTPNPQNNPSTLVRNGNSGLFRLFGNAQPYSDSFTYTIADANGNSDTATVNVNVEPTFRLKFTLSDNQAGFVNEIGLFTVDDELGTIDGIAPGASGYIEAALRSGRVIFSSLEENLFDLNSERIIDGFRNSDRLGFFLVQNSTVDSVLADLTAGATPADVFFANASANGNNFNYLNTSDLADGGFSLSWEDSQGGGDADFNDLTVTVETTTEPTPIGTALQGREERELLDLQNLSGSVQAEIEVLGEAAYNNSMGFYVVENERGTVIDPLTGQSLAPNDPGYAQAAIQQRIDLSINNDTGNLTAQIQAGNILAPYLISNSTPEEFLELNPNNETGQDPLAYFAYLGANPDGVDRIRLLGDNSWGFEDKYNSGGDYNDLVIRMSLTT